MTLSALSLSTAAPGSLLVKSPLQRPQHAVVVPRTWRCPERSKRAEAVRVAAAGVESPSRVAHGQHVERNSKPLSGDESWAWEREVVDLGGLDLSPERRARVVEQVRAGAEVGVFYIKNFGVELEMVDRVRAVMSKFFALPVEEKLKASKRQPGGRVFGYEPKFSKYGSWLAAFRELFKAGGVSHLNVWPEHMPELRETLEEFQELMRRGSVQFLAGLLTEGLGLPPSYLTDQYGDLQTINLYTCSPGLEGEPDLSKAAPALASHTDPIYFHVNFAGCDGASSRGLQHFVGGKWQSMPVFHDAALVTIGDDLETVSNGRYHSCLHRVLRGAEPRTSMLMSAYGNPQAVLAPAAQLIQSDTGPALYRPRIPGDHMLAMVKAYQAESAVNVDRSKKHLFFHPDLHLDKTKNMYLEDNQERLNGMPLQDWGATMYDY